MVNEDFTKFYEIKKGVRQGCPLSPLLFILALENLLIKIRANKKIKGLKVKREEYKAQAFADDLVFFIEEPLKTGPILIKEIEEFGKVAGLKINKDKTKMLTKNITRKQIEELIKELGLQVVEKVEYLGICLTARCAIIKENNYVILVQ